LNIKYDRFNTSERCTENTYSTYIHNYLTTYCMYARRTIGRIFSIFLWKIYLVLTVHCILYF